MSPVSATTTRGSAMGHDLPPIVSLRLTETGFSGVCLVKRGDEIILHEAFGLAHRGFGIPNTVNTRFDIASVTKTFTAAAVLQLIESGSIALETPVMPYLGIS